MSTAVGEVALDNPVMTAAGTSGLSLELGAYLDLAMLGAFVTKSLSSKPWTGNSGRNLAGTESGAMLNSVGLHNPGVQEWIRSHYPQLRQRGVHVVVNIWGRDENELFDAALAIAPLEDVEAIEVNLSCPNHEDPRLMVSHDPREVSKYISAVAEAVSGSTPIWAKLAPSTPDVVSCAQAAERSGASAVTLVNTLSAMEVDLDLRSATLSGVFGGLSGPPLHPVALRAIYQVHSALPRLPIVGVGGVCDARSALELMAVGASAIQVGTASFADPRASYKILRSIERWCRRRDTTPRELIGSIRADHLPEEFGHVEAG